jgi:hypothetical protein
VQVPVVTVPLQVSPVPSVTVTLPVGVPAAEVTVNDTTTPCPNTDGSGVWPVIVVVVLAGVTVWVTPAEVLVAKLPSPAYTAVTVRPPVEVNVIVQLPCATVALQLCVPSLTVTFPVGVPLPGAFVATVNVKLTACPTVDGLADWLVIAVVVLAAFTV